MRRTLSLLLIVSLGACASKPPAAEVCSADWIKPRTDAAFAKFRDATEEHWRALNLDGTDDAQEEGLFQQARLLLTLTQLLGEFKDSQSLKDLQTLSTTCNDPDLIQNALRSTLQEYQVPQRYIDMLDGLEGFMELMGTTQSTF